MSSSAYTAKGCPTVEYIAPSAPEWLDAEVNTLTSTLIPVFNPSTEEQIAEVADADQATVDAAVARARETFESGVWRKLPAAHRADVLFRAAAIIKERTEELAELEGQTTA